MIGGMSGMIRSDGSNSQEKAFGSVYDHRVIRRMFPYVARQKHLAAMAIASMLVYTVTFATVPWIVKVAIDDYIRAGDFTGLTWLVGLFIANATLSWGANFAMDLSLARAGQKMLYELRNDLFKHLHKQSVSYFDKTEVGRIMSRVMGDVYQLQQLLEVAVITLGDLSRALLDTLSPAADEPTARPSLAGSNSPAHHRDGAMAAPGQKGVHPRQERGSHRQRVPQREYSRCPRRSGDEPPGQEPA